MLKRIDWESHIGRRLRLRDLHAFFAVVHAGSMAKAAEQLGVSQPAVSKVVADLEHALGVRLLDRSRRGVEPTPYGEALMKGGLAAFDELKQCIKHIQFLADPMTGELKIGCPGSLGATVLPQLIERFSKKYPRVVVHVHDVPSPAVKDPGLRDRRFDLSLARLRNPPPIDQPMNDLNVEYLFSDPLILAAGMHTPWARRRKIKLAELMNEPWIMPPSNTWNYACVAEAFKAQGLDMPKASLISNSTNVLNHFLANGSFIAANTRSAVRLHSLKELPVDMTVWHWPVVILTLKDRTQSPTVERFIDSAREVAKSIIARP